MLGARIDVVRLQLKFYRMPASTARQKKTDDSCG